MNQFHKLFRWAWSILVVCALAFAMGGCEGDDGAQGPAGPTGAAGADGAQGPPGPGASITPLESCAVCHDDGSFASAPAAHALDPIEDVSNVAISLIAGTDDLLVEFDLARDGMLTAGYDTIERAYRTEGTTQTSFVGDVGPLTDFGDGSYSFIIPDGNLVAGDNRYLFRVAAGDDRETRVYFYQDYPASPFAGPAAVTAESCAACHGPEGIDVHGGYFAADDGAEPCLTCHGVFGFGRNIPSLGEAAHKYHSSIWEEDGEVVHITYPTYMTNCSVCHSASSGLLAAANAMPISGPGCLSCHGSMEYEGWDFTGGLSFHLTNIVDPLTHDCATSCHEPGGAASSLVVVTDAHNGLETGRGGIIFDGLDTSVEEGKNFDWQITNIVDDGVNLAVSWTASYNGVGVDPCNDTVGAGAPVFHAGDGSVRIYRSYAQGDDFIMGASTSAPGQPARVNVTVDNTACAGGVATTTIPVEAMDAEKARVVLGGKPMIESDLLDPPGIVEARVPTPTYDWVVGDGAAAEPRRNVVDTEQCLGCHVGSLYQHGGDRVDNVDVCLVCHNAASNEQSVRVGMGVDASEAYDGQVGETFELKTMLHRIHSAGLEGQPPYVIYRNRGIYAFAPDTTGLPNWPGTGQQVVFGSNDVTTNHNFHAPTYPRSINECTACHTEDFTVLPNQAVSMANTVEAGSEVWENQLDDVLQGAGTTACVTCHADSASKGHAYQNSWDPQEFPEGRQTIIDAGN